MSLYTYALHSLASKCLGLNLTTLWPGALPWVRLLSPLSVQVSLPGPCARSAQPYTVPHASGTSQDSRSSAARCVPSHEGCNR